MKPPALFGPAVATVVAAMMIVSLSTTLRYHSINLEAPYAHVDASIPLGVARHLREGGFPDTNWAHADVPAHFRYDQYNFSSYILSFAAWDSVSPLSSERDLALFSTVCFLGGILALALFVGLRFGWAGAIVAASGMATTSLLVQDSFYGRAESFLTLIALACLGLSGMRSRTTQMLACGLAGFAIACKISFAPIAIAVLAAPCLLGGPRRLLWTAAGFPAVALGFAAGAPGAVMDPEGFIHGVRYLQEQYASFHWPHGSPDPGLIPQLSHAFSYFVAAAGPLTLVLLAGSSIALCIFVVLRYKTSDTAIEAHVALFALAALATVAYFSISRTFFERNTSHAIALLWVPVGWAAAMLFRSIPTKLPGWGVRIGMAAALMGSIAPMAMLSATIAQVIADPKKAPLVAAQAELERRVLAEHPDKPQLVEFAYISRDAAPKLCLRASMANDEAVVKLITHRYPAGSAIDDPRLQPLGSAPGPFEHIPVSTLHTYHAASVVYYLLSPRSARAAHGGCE